MDEAVEVKPEAPVIRGYLVFEHYGYTPRTKKWRVRSRSDGGLLGIIEWYAPWSGYTFVVRDVKESEELRFSIGCQRIITEFCLDQMSVWRRIEKMGTEQCPECGGFMQVGRKEAYAKDGDKTVVIYLVVKRCPKCQHTESENYKDRVKAMGLKPY